MASSGWQRFRKWAASRRQPREGELLAEGVARFVDPGGSRRTRRPFPGYQHPPIVTGCVNDHWPLRPQFATVDRTTHIELDVDADLYGLGEHAGPLRLNGRRITCWNTDAWGYDDRNESLYQSHPWVLGVRPDGSAFGMLVETTCRCTFDMQSGIIVAVDDHAAPVVIILGDSAEQVLRRLAGLIGTIDLPPRWALGYHQCRYSYESAAVVREIAGEFRSRQIPCDAIWMDIDYMRGFRCFTFDPDRFADPSGLRASLAASGFKAVWMIDPGIKAEPEWEVYASGREHFVRAADGREFRGKVWPGPCAFPDFTRASARDWWASLHPGFLHQGVDGLWNDMNEPAIFDAPGKTMPTDARHEADADLGGPDSHARYHNIYGMQMARASHGAWKSVRPGTRPFLLSRANFIGGHRYACAWTGDNTSDWRHLRWSISMIVNLGLSGQPFSGPDIGGFSGNADAALFARWMGIGALLPLARGHSEKDTKPHEPWAFGPDCERTCRLALERRMRLIPYLYTIFEEAARTGVPVVRPAFMVDAKNPKFRDRDDIFLLGADVLVEARVEADAGRSPAAEWPTFEPSEPDPDLPDLRIRPGAIVPLGPAMNHTGEHPLDPLTLVVCPDASGLACGELYEDSGDGYDHERGAFRRLRFEWHPDPVPEHDRVSPDHPNLLVRRVGGDWSLPTRRTDVILLSDEASRESETQPSRALV